MAKAAFWLGQPTLTVLEAAYLIAVGDAPEQLSHSADIERHPSKVQATVRRIESETGAVGRVSTAVGRRSQPPTAVTQAKFRELAKKMLPTRTTGLDPAWWRVSQIAQRWGRRPADVMQLVRDRSLPAARMLDSGLIVESPLVDPIDRRYSDEGAAYAEDMSTKEAIDAKQQYAIGHVVVDDGELRFFEWARGIAVESRKSEKCDDTRDELKTRERTSFLRIIRALDVLAKLPERGPSGTVEKQLQGLGFMSPQEATVRKVIEEARSLSPD